LNAKARSRKILKVLAWITGTLVALAVSFHFWFVNHAEEIIENLVSSQSNGKLHLKVKKFKFNWFSKKMELEHAVFYSTDTATSSAAYQFDVERLQLEVKAVFPILFEKKILIDSLRLVNPHVTVTKLRTVQRDTTSDNDISIPKEMGRIYNSIQDALSVLKVKRFQIENGRFSLYNRMRPEQQPVEISKIFFNLDNLQVADTNTTNAAQKIFFSDNISLSTHNQDIALPDGIHRLAFKNFRINVLRKLVELDSCTVSASRQDSSGNSFRVFFEKLKLTNIDFDTLYHSEVIKADSVYCFRPRFRLDVQLPDRKKGGTTKPPPSLNEIVQQLTGDMQLAFVIVEDGSFDINTMRAGRPSSFTSEHNNFEITGLRVQQRAKRPLSVDGFKMGIRNFENFLRDSTYSIQFDSILFNNNRISLSNFSYRELTNNRTINTLTVPQLELQGLSWDNLVLEQQLMAEKVTLYKPAIRYHVRNNPGKSQTIFEVLSGLGEMMQLSNLHLIEGQVSLVFPNKSELELEKATLHIAGRDLVNSKQLKGIQQSVTRLDFAKGRLHVGPVTALLQGVQFTGETNHLRADVLEVTDISKAKIKASGVNIRTLVIDDKLQQTRIEGISWDSAVLNLPLGRRSAPQEKREGFILRDVDGRRTRVFASDDTRQLEVYFKHIGAESFSSGKRRHFRIKALDAAGGNLRYRHGAASLEMDRFDLRDGEPSHFQSIRYQRSRTYDTIIASIPMVQLVPDIDAFFRGDIGASAITLDRPRFFWHARHHDTLTNTQETGWPLPDTRINSLKIIQPTLSLQYEQAGKNFQLEWEGNDPRNYLQLQDIVSDETSTSFSARTIQFLVNGFTVAGPSGRRYHAGSGEIDAKLSNLRYRELEGNDTEWEGQLDQLNARNFTIDSIGKKNATLQIKTASLSGLRVDAASILKLTELIQKNKEFRLSNFTGTYQDSAVNWNWYNTAYDKRSRLLSLDSFRYRPAPEKEAFMEKQKHQIDYITANGGKLEVGPLDIDRFVKDTILDLGTIRLSDAYLYNFRDKRLPLRMDIVRPLPVDQLTQIGTKFRADSLVIANSRVLYEELNEKTGKSGLIRVGDLNATLTHLRNFDLGEQDSLVIHANGRLEDSIAIQLRLKESYTDTLSGFRMQLRMGPADLTILNPVLAPLASAELKSGHLDSLTMQVNGREYLAYGEMHMHYRNLRIRILKKGNPDKKSFLSSVMSGLANAFVVKKNNDSRKGVVFFRRHRERSALNYLVKITLSGVTSSVGARSNKKQTKRYQQTLKEKQLPPVEDATK
jgi:hypothetical protein